MKYEFRVKFWRSWEDDREVIEKTFPNLHPLAGAVAQFCAELDNNPVLKGNYTVENAELNHGHTEERFTVLFAFEFNPDPFQTFRSCVQKGFNEGMAGEYAIDDNYKVDGNPVTYKTKKPTK